MNPVPESAPTAGAGGPPDGGPTAEPTPRWTSRFLRPRLIAISLLVVAALAAGGAWRRHVTRPDHRLTRGEEAVRAHDWKSAEEYARRLEATGYADHASLLRAEIAYGQKLPDRALEQCNRIRDDGPLRVRAAALSGKCLLDLGEPAEAYRVFRFVVDEDPDNADAHRGLAVITYDLGQLNRAIAHLEQVVRLDPADARPHRFLGDIYRDLGTGERAEAEYREALRLRAGLSAEALHEVRFELADALVRMSRFADALEVLDEAAAGRREPPYMLALRVEALRGLGRRVEAVALADQALAEFREGAFYRLRGQLFLDDGNAAAAVPLLEEAVRRSRTHYQTHFLLAQAYAAAGRKADADRTNAGADNLKRDLERAGELNREAMAKPWDAAVRLQLADLFDRLQDPKLAAMWRKAAAGCLNQNR